jgi:hypothetical protein
MGGPKHLRDDKNRSALISAVRIVLIIVCSAVVICHLPIGYLEILDRGEALLASPVGMGSPFVTFYVHSLQLTPVIDEYRIIGGEIWTWEERVQSHNAGLPFAAPEHGSFVMAPPWMIVRGGRMAMNRIAYRVGTEELGKNRWALPPFGEIQAYEAYRSKRLTFLASVRKLASAPVIGWKAEKTTKTNHIYLGGKTDHGYGQDKKHRGVHLKGDGGAETKTARSPGDGVAGSGDKQAHRGRTEQARAVERQARVRGDRVGRHC